MNLYNYQTPLYGGLLSTGDETPAWPYAFAGIGLAALLALAFLRRRKAKAD